MVGALLPDASGEEESMSITDREVDDDDRVCRCCGLYVDSQNRQGPLCWNCHMDNVDLYADAKIQDEKEKS